MRIDGHYIVSKPMSGAIANPPQNELTPPPPPDGGVDPDRDLNDEPQTDVVIQGTNNLLELLRFQYLYPPRRENDPPPQE